MTEIFTFSDPPSIYLDLSGGDASPQTAAELAPDVLIHVDELGAVVGVEVLNAKPAQLVTLTGRDALYLDLSAGAAVPDSMAELGSGLWVHYANHEIVGLELREQAARGTGNVLP